MRGTETISRGRTRLRGLILGSTTVTEAEIGLVVGQTAGTVAASKAVIAGATKNSDVRPTVTAYAANGALAIAHGTAKLTKAGVNAMTLASPVAADEGIRMLITAQTANAHTVTYTAGFNGAGAAGDVATFGGAIGDCMEIVAINLVWNVISVKNVVLG